MLILASCALEISSLWENPKIDVVKSSALKWIPFEAAIIRSSSGSCGHFLLILSVNVTIPLTFPADLCIFDTFLPSPDSSYSIVEKSVFLLCPFVACTLPDYLETFELLGHTVGVLSGDPFILWWPTRFVMRNAILPFWFCDAASSRLSLVESIGNMHRRLDGSSAQLVLSTMGEKFCQKRGSTV